MYFLCLCVYECIGNPYFRLFTNHTIHALLASSPEISIIVAIDSDGTTSLQNDTLVLARPNSDNIVGEFQQDSDNFQLYHFMFPPLQRQDMGQYEIYSGINVTNYLSCMYIRMFMCYTF